jgi:hypothetical protein
LQGALNDQRKMFKQGYLSKERIEMLKEIGFEWQVKHPNWMGRYQELIDFKSTHGHCRVPYKYKDN